MKFSTTLIAVSDMERSLQFYKDLFGQDVAVDLGWNKMLSCGLTLQQHFDKIAGFDKDSMQYKTHNMELYFETEDMDAFMTTLDAHPEVERLHDLRTFPWHQQGIHIYDPDGHLIEVSESMSSVAFREFNKGFSEEEVAEITQHPIELVKQWHKAFIESHNSN